MTLVTNWKLGPKMWKYMLNMCASHDIMGALTLVVSDVTWQLAPANITNPVDIAAGQTAVYRNRPNCDQLTPKTPLREKST